MHILDGVLPPNVCIAGYAVTGGMTWYSLRRIRQTTNPQAEIPKASLLTATFFVASLIHIPVPPSSIHLVLNGFMGVILGYYAFPAILIGLFFQVVMFQHGGLSTLGINAVIMGIPALLAHHIFQLKNYAGKKPIATKIFAFLAGAAGIGLAALLFVVITITNIAPDLDAQIEQTAIYLSLFGYSIQMLIEGTFTVMSIAFLQQVKPEMLKI